MIQARQFRETKAPGIRPGDADYDLIKMLGQGGMGVVYLARASSLFACLPKGDAALRRAVRHESS